MRWLRSSASRRRASDSITFDKCLACWDRWFGAEILPLVHIVIMGPMCHKIVITKKTDFACFFNELNKLRFKHVSQFHFLFCLKSIWWRQKCQSQCSKNEWVAKWWFLFLPGMIGGKADSQFDGASHILADGFFRLNHQLGWITVLSWPWVWTWCIRNWRSLFGRPVDFARWEVRLQPLGWGWEVSGWGPKRCQPGLVEGWVGNGDFASVFWLGWVWGWQVGWLG